jgi:predicted HTH transcriptional regulator
MKIHDENEDFELDLYMQILDYFQKDKVNKENTEIWKDQSFIELMKLLEQKKNRDMVTNAIILMLSLFEDIPPDIYNNRGVDISRISIEERKSLFAGLEEEFLPN